jgi:hypothetical protein
LAASIQSPYLTAVYTSLPGSTTHWTEHKVVGVTDPQCHGGIAVGDIDGDGDRDVDGDGDIDILTKPWRGDLHLFVENMLNPPRAAAAP